MGKVTTEAQEKSSFLTKYLVELFKNHRLTKIFQKEKYESNRADNYLNQLKEKNKKIGHVIVRISPIMEVLTGFNDCYSNFLFRKINCHRRVKCK